MMTSRPIWIFPAIELDKFYFDYGDKDTGTSWWTTGIIIQYANKYKHTAKLSKADK